MKAFIHYLLSNTLFFIAFNNADGFTCQTNSWAPKICTFQTSTSSTALDAKKRRRRRVDGQGNRDVLKKETDDSPTDIEDINFSMDDELPDFDLGEKEQLPEVLASRAEAMKEDAIENVKKDVTSIGDLSMDSSMVEDDPLVMEAMRGRSQSKSFASPKDLLRSRDRNLEATFEFDDVANPLPRPGQIKSGVSKSDDIVAPTMGKKRARSEARKAAAMEAAGQEEDGEGIGDIAMNVLEKLPFFPKRDPSGEVSTIKLLEQGTWFCIYVLIAWELYINSPLFERSSPIIPVVY